MNRIFLTLSKNIRGHDTKTNPLFVVPIGNAKITKKVVLHPESPVLKCHQKTSNSCCLSCLESAFYSIGDNRVVTDLVKCIEESLTLHTDKFRSRIHFTHDIITNRIHIKCEQHLRYNTRICNKKDEFDILNNISKNDTLVQLMDSIP